MPASNRHTKPESTLPPSPVRRIPLQRRVEIFRVLVVSTVLAGVGTWPVLNGQELQLFAGGVLSMYRQLLCLRAEGGFHCTSIAVLDSCRLWTSCTSHVFVSLGSLVDMDPTLLAPFFRTFPDFSRRSRTQCSGFSLRAR